MRAARDGNASAFHMIGVKNIIGRIAACTIGGKSLNLREIVPNINANEAALRSININPGIANNEVMVGALPKKANIAMMMTQLCRKEINSVVISLYI